MRDQNEELEFARREIERLTREVTELQAELDGTTRALEGQRLSSDAGTDATTVQTQSPVSTQQESAEHTRVEQELRESEQRFRTLFELLPASISFSRKFDHMFLEVNRGFEESSGYRREEVIGRSSRDLNLWTTAKERDTLLRLLDRSDEVRNFELRVQSRHGEERQMSFSATSVIVGGEPGWLSVLTDVTALRAAEEAIRDNERLLQLLVENSTDILGVISAAGVHVSLRGPLQRILGYAPEERIGHNALEFIHPDDAPAVRDVINALSNTPGLVRRVEFRHRHKQGRWVAMEAMGANRLEEPGINGIVINVRDISERKEAEQERAKLHEQLQQALKMEAIGRLAGGIAHDFNNLLTAISGNLELAKLELDPADPLQLYLVEAAHASNSATDLTRQLLTFSRRQLIEPRVINVNELLGKLRKMLGRLIGEDVELVTTFADDLGSVRIDPGQLQQVLVNLCVNARDAMPDGGRLVIETGNSELDESFCHMHPDVQPGRFVRIAVIDNGQGMSEEVRERIFEPFFTTKGEGRGTGLGLAMVFGAVKQAGGVIDVYSELGMGTTFRIYLPSIEEPSEHLEQITGRIELPCGNEYILLVEDSASVRELAAAMLKRLGYRVLIAGNAGEALLMAEQHRETIDLLFTDVVMPGMNGRALSERLQKFHPEMRVLFASGYTEDTIVRHGVMDEAMHYIGKPYSLQALSVKVRRVLDSPRNAK
jgi:PAS domain S-box-containing protein